MPFTGSTFTLPLGSVNAVPGSIVQSATWNAIHADLNTGLTQTMAQLISTPTTRNILVVNGSLDVWQRGSGSTASIAVAASTTAYTADRWYVTTGVNQASVISATTALANSSLLAGKILRNAAQTGVTAYTFGYPLDTDEITAMRGSKVSLSFLAKTGVNWSPTNGTFSVALYVGTGAVAKRGGGFTSETQVITIATNLAASSATTAIAGTSTIVVPVTATQAELQFTWTPVGTAGADDSITFDDVQLEANLSTSTWTPTAYDRLKFEAEYNFCKRHYKKTQPYNVAPAQNSGLLGALVYSSSAISKIGVQWNFDIDSRVVGTVTTFNPQAANANWQNITVPAAIVATIDTASASNSTKFIYIGGATIGAGDNQALIHCQVDSGI